MVPAPVDVAPSKFAAIDAQNLIMAHVHFAIMKVEPIQTIDRLEEVLKDQINLYEIAIDICKQDNLKLVLQDGLRKVQQELTDLRYGRPRQD